MFSASQRIKDKVQGVFCGFDRQITGIKKSELAIREMGVGCFAKHFINKCLLFYFSCTVDGLPLNEFRVLSEKAAATPEYRDEKNRRVEFATPTFNVLNALEQMGYRLFFMRPTDCFFIKTKLCQPQYI